MTPERRKEIETLLAQITPGEWTWHKSINTPAYPVAAYADLRVETPTPDKPWNAELAYVLQPLTTGVVLGRNADIAFIAACAGEKGIVRELLAEVERLQQVVNDVWFIAEGGATDYIPAEKRQELLEDIARRTRG